MMNIAYTPPSFQRAFWIAFAIHVVVLFALDVLPFNTRSDVPFQIVNIRLAEHITRDTQSEQPVTNKQVAATNITQAAPKPAPPPPLPETKPEDAQEMQAEEDGFKKERLWKRARGQDDRFRPVARTLEDYVEKGENQGAARLDPESEEAVRQRFTQVLSLWLYKFRDYPESARAAGLTGKALIRLRIERSGRVLFYQLDQSTGHGILDSAIRDMIYRASPVPKAPPHFPGGEQLEFIIPIAFTLD